MPIAEELTPLDGLSIKLQVRTNHAPAFDHENGIHDGRICACLQNKLQCRTFTHSVTTQDVGSLGRIIALVGILRRALELELGGAEPRFGQLGQLSGLAIGHTMKHYPCSRFLLFGVWLPLYVRK